MPTTTYPTRNPITNAGIEAFLASVPTQPRTARVTLRVKRSAELVERMADDMRTFGEGMTRQDLRRLGYTESQIDACGEDANRRALSRSAGLN